MASFSHLTSTPLSSRVRSQMRARFAELGGLGLLVLAAAIAVSLWSYNPRDPSYNTATGALPTNLLGGPGAFIADALVQWLGIASAVPVLVLVAWSWRVIRHHTLNFALPGLVAFLLLMPAAAASVSLLQQIVPGIGGIAWPSRAGFGGLVGLSLGRHALEAGRAELGAGGIAVSAALVWLFTLLLLVLAIGLKRNEWGGLLTGAAFVGRQPARIYRAAAGRAAPKPSEAPWQPAMAPPGAGRSGAYGAPNPMAQARGGMPHNTGWLQPHDLDEEPDEATRTPYPGPQRQSRPAAAPPAVAAMAASPAAGETANALALRPEPVPAVAPARPATRAPAPVRDPAPAPAVAAFTDDADESPAVADTAPRRSFFDRLRGEKAAPQARRETPSGTDQASWILPPLSLLHRAPPHTQAGPSREVLQANARLLETVLADYGVQGTIGDIHAGPVVTLYELEPAPGIRSARVIGLADDIARSLSVLSVRIATVPGRNVIGIEVPNAHRETVYFSELLETDAWHDSSQRLCLALGKDIAGGPVYGDLARMPHLLIAGTTGSGKSVGVNAMILSLLYRLSPDQCRLILIDPKILELSIYEGIPHLLTPVVTEPTKAVAALKWAVREMDKRYRAMSHLQVRNIAGYNDRVRQARDAGDVVTRRVQTGFDPETGRPVFDEQQLTLETLPHIVVVIDEMADLMMVAGKEVESAVQRLAQKARAAGIHVIMATQRPSVDVITGTIKANFPTRISFQVISKFDSRTILQEQGAEQLLGQGDMLYMQGGGRITRVHGPFVADDEVEAVVADLRSKGEPVYNDDVVSSLEEEAASSSSGASGNGMGGGGYDTETSLFDQAVQVVAREGKASTSFIQRHLSIGYNRAAKLIEQMEKEGIVSAANHVGRREVLIRREQPVED